MRNVRTLAALTGLVLLIGLVSIRSGLLPARADGQGPEGAWGLAVHIPGQADDVSLATFHADGTMIVSDRPIVVQTGPTGVLTRSFASAGHGVWARQAGSLPGDRTFSLTFVEINGDETGSTPTHVKIRATIQLSEAGDAFSGPFAYTVTDPFGRALASGRGTVEARRIGIEPLN